MGTASAVNYIDHLQIWSTATDTSRKVRMTCGPTNDERMATNHRDNNINTDGFVKAKKCEYSTFRTKRRTSKYERQIILEGQAELKARVIARK